MPTTGGEPALIVVDDPHGFVVPSDGVQIVRELGRCVHTIGHIGHSMAGAVAASMLINMGFDRTERVLEHHRTFERKVKAPVIRGPKVKEKRLHKGLRP